MKKYLINGQSCFKANEMTEKNLFKWENIGMVSCKSILTFIISKLMASSCTYSNFERYAKENTKVVNSGIQLLSQLLKTSKWSSSHRLSKKKWDYQTFQDTDWWDRRIINNQKTKHEPQSFILIISAKSFIFILFYFYIH